MPWRQHSAGTLPRPNVFTKVAPQQELRSDSDVRQRHLPPRRIRVVPHLERKPDGLLSQASFVDGEDHFHRPAAVDGVADGTAVLFHGSQEVKSHAGLQQLEFVRRALGVADGGSVQVGNRHGFPGTVDTRTRRRDSG